MNLFNRLVVIVLLLLLIVAVVVVVAWPLPTIEFLTLWLSYLGAGINQYTWTIMLVVGVAIGLLCLILLIMEVRRPRRKDIHIGRVNGGHALLRADSVARRIAWHVDRLADVVKCAPRVRARGNSVEVTLDVETGPEIDVPMKTEEIIAVVRDQVEQKMGLKLQTIRVHVRNTPYPAEPAYAREARQSWTSPAPSTPSVPSAGQEQ